ncbi:MAG: outer membrane lipoprotein-sorting protein [Spirochaetota bacterium]
MNQRNLLQNITRARSARVIFCLLFSAPLAAQNLKEPEKAKQIAYKMIKRDDGKTSYNRTKVITCAFEEQGGKRKCSGQARTKSFESISKDVGPQLEDTIGLSVIDDPADEKGSAFLQKDYEVPGKDTEQWMYLPALRKLKRIVAESSNAPKTGTLFGSEIAYEDIEKVRMSDYNYSYLGEETVDGRPCYILESFPTAYRAPKSSYGRGVLWVDKASYLVLKSDSYDRQNRLVKTFFSKDLEVIGGVAVAKQLIVVNHKNRRMSLMKLEKVKINVAIPDALFDTRAVQDSAFRESQMGSVR